VRAGCLNAHLDRDSLYDACEFDAGDSTLLEQAAQTMGLTLRACHKICKVSRTIADLDGALAIERPHVFEALSLRVRTARVPD